jgi:hypothetical protein
VTNSLAFFICWYSGSTRNSIGCYDLHLRNTCEGWEKVSIIGVREEELMLSDFEAECSFK